MVPQLSILSLPLNRSTEEASVLATTRPDGCTEPSSFHAGVPTPSFLLVPPSPSVQSPCCNRTSISLFNQLLSPNSKITFMSTPSSIAPWQSVITPADRARLQVSRGFLQKDSPLTLNSVSTSRWTMARSALDHHR